MGWGAITQQLNEAREKQAAFENGEYKARAFPLFLKSGESAEVSFIDDEPWSGKIHTLKPPSGKGLWLTRKCLGANCPYCEQGDKPKFRAFFTVVDHRTGSFINKKGELVETKDQVRYYECSAATADMLFNKFNKQAKKLGVTSLTEVVVDISKYGSGTSTTTSFDIYARENQIIPEGAKPIDFDEEFSTNNSKYD